MARTREFPGRRSRLLVVVFVLRFWLSMYVKAKNAARKRNGVTAGPTQPSRAALRGSSNLWLQVWESDGDIYWLSWLIICPARRPGELFGGSGGLGEAVSDH